MRERTEAEDPWKVVEFVAAVAVLLTIVALAPFVAVLLHSGRVAELSLADAVLGTARVVGESRWSDPASAFAPDARRNMPGVVGWWLAACVTMTVVGAVAVWTWRRVDAYVSRASAARRPHDLRGSRRRTWARPRDLAGSVHRTRRPGRFTLGRLDGRLLLSDAESHVALIAPTRSGKTTRYVIPWLLEHDGPAIVTSTKLDVVEATREARRRKGEVWVWDPFGEESARWSPLRGCVDWSYALAQAQWIADSSGEGDSEIAAYWRGEAAKLLAPLLHAAALDAKSMPEVLSWVDGQALNRARQILADAKREDAKAQLNAVMKLDARNRGTTFMSAGSLLAAYRYPELAQDGPEFTVRELFNGGSHTLYLVASARHQRLLAPLVVGMVSAVLHEAAELARHGPVSDRTLRVLLDEVANIAPLRDLPAHLSQAAGHGVRFATVWQSLAQLQDRYRAGADSVLANSTSKVFMGPVTDERTRRYVQGLVGEEPVETRSRTRAGALDAQRQSETRAVSLRPALSATELQQLGVERALVVEGHRKPALVSTRAWWSEASW